MKWTFGIISNPKREDYYHIDTIITSIENNNIGSENYEIIVVGNVPSVRKNLRVIPFDESIKFPSSWTTRKKNVVCENAKFENIVLQHDYVMYDSKWYEEFEKFGDDWEICMTRILNQDGWRFRDWTLWPPGFLPYDDISQTDKMYISGAYWCAKKSFMLKNPLDEKLMWAQSEDVEWSLRCRTHWKYRCNPKSIVKFLKFKEHNPSSSPDF